VGLERKLWYNNWKALVLLLLPVLAFRIWWFRDTLVAGDDAGNYLITMHWLFQDVPNAVFNYRPPLIGVVLAPFWYLGGIDGLKALALLSSLLIAVPVFMLTRNALIAAATLLMPMMEQPLLWGFLLYFSLALFLLLIYYRDNLKVCALLWFLLAGCQQTGYVFAVGIFAVIALVHWQKKYIWPAITGLVWIPFYLGRQDESWASLLQWVMPYRQPFQALGMALLAVLLLLYVFKPKDLKVWAPVVAVSLFVSLLSFKNVTLGSLCIRAPYYFILSLPCIVGIAIGPRVKTLPLLLGMAIVLGTFIPYNRLQYTDAPDFYRTLTPDVVAAADWLKTQPFQEKDMVICFPGGTGWWVQGLSGHKVWVTLTVDTKVFEYQYANAVIEGRQEWNGYVIIDTKTRDIDYARSTPAPNWEALNPYLVKEFGTVRMFHN
jgi:hypothetical protein